MGPPHDAGNGDEKARQRDAPHQADVEATVARQRVWGEPIAAPGGRAIADLDQHHVPRFAESGCAYLEASGPKARERATYRHEVGQEAREARHRIPQPHHLGSKPEPGAVHEVLVQHPPRVKRRGPGGHEPPHGAHRIVPIDADELGEVVPAADRDDAEHGIPARAQDPVCDLVHRAIAADGDDAPNARPRRPLRQLHPVPRPFGPFGLNGPALALELARDRIERARRRAASRGGVQDDVGLDQRPHYKRRGPIRQRKRASGPRPPRPPTLAA